MLSVMEIVLYGNPILRKKGRKIEHFDLSLKRLAQQMIQTMRENNGVGLAAQQVGLDLQLFVVDVSNVTDIPSSLEIDGKLAPLGQWMPLVCINSQIELRGNFEFGVEGCLSFPEIFGEIPRAEVVTCEFQDLEGRLIKLTAKGFLARVIQHEYDHTQGILFIDRMDLQSREQLRAKLTQLWRANQRLITKSD